MEFRELISMEFHGIPWNSMALHGVPWGYFTRVIAKELFIGDLNSLAM